MASSPAAAVRQPHTYTLTTGARARAWDTAAIVRLLLVLHRSRQQERVNTSGLMML